MSNFQMVCVLLLIALFIVSIIWVINAWSSGNILETAIAIFAAFSLFFILSELGRK